MAQTPTREAELKYAREFLLAGERVRLRPVERQQLSLSLPEVMEELRCGQLEVSRSAAESQLRALWAQARSSLQMAASTGWPALAGACLQASEVLGIDLEGADEAFIFALRRRARGLSGVRVHALVHGGTPTRIYRAPLLRPATLASAGEEVVRARALARGVLGLEQEAVWGTDRDIRGPSKLAGFLLRELVAWWPEAFEGISDIGITGELDEQGLALGVSGVKDKVRSFFKSCPEGLCLVPAANWGEALAAVEEQGRSFSLRRNRLHPFHSITQLLVRCGIVSPHVEATRLFRDIREHSRGVSDWKNRQHEVDWLIDLSVSEAREQERPDAPSSSTGLDIAKVVRRLRAEAPRATGHAGASLQGGAGSGKSMWLRRLHHELSEGAERWGGPSVRIDGRRFQRGATVAFLVAESLGGAWDTRAVARLLDSPQLAGSVWLLVDGVDEVTEEDRADLLAVIARWRGPFVLTARPLRIELPGALQLRVDSLDPGDATALLEREGRKDLAGEGALFREDFDPGADPMRVLLQDFCRTPLGASLAAVIIPPGGLQGQTRQSLLADGFKVLIDRARSEGRLSEPRRSVTFFEFRGERLLGEAAWRMLAEGRAELRAEDFDSRLPVEDLDLLRDLLDNGGFAQWVGPRQWAFNHKSFAEHCAARCLLACEPGAALEALLAGLGRPGVEEVLLHVAAELPRDRLCVLLRRMLEHEDLPLSALSLATRVLLRVEPARLAPGAAVAVLARRLRLLTGLPGLHLPGALDRDTSLWSALTRLKQARLLGPRECQALVEACHADVREWFQEEARPLGYGEEWSYGPKESAENRCTRRRRELAEQLARVLDLEVPVLALLRFEKGGELLTQRRAQGAWVLQDLLPVLHHEDARIAANARTAWLRCAPVDVMLEHLEFISDWPDWLTSELLDVLRQHGSEHQRKEGLMRIVMGRLPCPVTDWEGDPLTPLPLGRFLRDISSQQWLGLWDWAWYTGALGGDGGSGDLALERFYALYLRAPCAPARWRALVAWRCLRMDETAERGSWPLDEVRALLRDEPFSEVRIEALELLHEAGEPVPTELLCRSLVTACDAERWMAWRAAIRAGVNLSIEQLVNVMVPLTPKPKREGWEGLPRWRREAESHGESARSALIQYLWGRCQSSAELETFLRLQSHEPWKAPVDDALNHFWFTPPPVDRLKALLGSEHPGVRVWAARTLKHRRPLEAAALLEGLVEDGDPEVAAIARKAVEFQRRFRLPTSTAPQTQTVPRRPVDERTVSGYSLLATRMKEEKLERVESFRHQELERYHSFEALWAALREHPLQLKQDRDMVPVFNEEAIDFQDFLAGQARAENLQVLRDVMHRLNALYTPEHQHTLITSLDDPYVGYLAGYLLQSRPRERALLTAFRCSETSAIRAATIARNSLLQAAATQAFISALTSWCWPVPVDLRPYRSPRWVSALDELGGLEGLVRLLEANPPEHVRDQVLCYIDKTRSELTARLAKGLREPVAAWARREVEKGGSEEARVTAIHLLALVGEREDAQRWAKALSHGGLSPAISIAAVELIARKGTEEHLPLLENLLESAEPEVVVAALDALGSWARPARLLELMHQPPRAIREAEATFPPPRWSWRRSLAKDIIERGDGEQALELARLMRDENLWGLTPRLGRLPEHALLVAGYVNSDPGERTIPASITGGGDETIDSDVPEQAERFIEQLARTHGADPVRDAFVEGLLWSGDDRVGPDRIPPELRESYDSYVGQYFRNMLWQLGGPRVENVPRLIAHLRKERCSDRALDLLAATGGGERELVTLWTELRVPWWAPLDQDPASQLG